MAYKGNMNQPLSADEVFRDMRKKILKLELEPGQKLSENQMCDIYGVSRSVIRIVFTRLNQLHLLDIYPQRGTYVSHINLDHIQDLLVLRTAVEKEVLYEIFHNIREVERMALVEKLEENLAEQEQYRDSKTYETSFKRLDSSFHKMMIDSVERYRLVELLNDYMIHVTRWRNFDVVFDSRIPELIDQHRAILDAIKENNLMKAQQCMAVHLETISGINDRAKAKYPQYFVNDSKN